MSSGPDAPLRPGLGPGIFGLSSAEDDALVVLVPVPWEATTSYGGGASEGPRAIFDASHQVDLFDLDVDRPYRHGIHMLEVPTEIATWSSEGKAAALAKAIATVNALSTRVNDHVEKEVSRLLTARKIVGIIGGDHSVPYGAIRALAAHKKAPFGILHFDAHSDTRRAYQGFVHSHASIMFNVLETIPEVQKLVQVGIRDVCEEEMEFCAAQGARVVTFSDRTIVRKKHDGEPFTAIAREIATSLPDEVWVSFDIDGLDPRYCPHTGTPVPGGLELHEATAILREVVRAKKTILGFDLNEVAPNVRDEADEWDGNVGARLLYKLVGFTLASQGKTRLWD